MLDAFLRGSGFEFSDPLFLLLALVAPFVFMRANALPATVTYSSLSLVDTDRRSFRSRLIWLPPLLLALATVALAVALAGPRTGDAVSEVQHEGIAIAMVVDRSSSMEARDFVKGDTSTSRLDVVKEIFRDFVQGGGDFGEGRPDDLIGLVTFARYADGLCPLTLDHGNLIAILEEIETPYGDPNEDGTAVGEGLALAVERLRRQETASKVVILLTDGVNNAGDIEPIQAAELAAQHGIKVYTVGAGYSGFAPFPVQRRDGRMVLQRVAVEIDEVALEQIAQKSGGRYFHATNKQALREVLEEIGRLERSEVSEIRYLEYEYHFAPWVGLALAAVALAALLANVAAEAAGMIGSPLHFAHPELAPLLWAWLAVVIALVVLERRGSGALDRLVGLALQDRLIDRPSPWRRWVRVGLIGVAGAAMALAIMQPQMGERYVSTPRVGAEIMIALDVSRSMLADDAKPSRLERAKAEIRDLLSYLGDDYVGLIAFAGRASVLSPMTPDKSFLRLALDSAGPHSVSRGGTRLAEPIRRAVAGLGAPGPAQRALILITDGEDHDSFALDAAKAAAEAGIKIIAIGFGDEGGSPIYIRDPQTGARSPVRDADGNTVVSRLNGDLLRELALATDGAFVPAGTGVLDLASIYDAHIAQLTRGQLDERGRTIRDEVYQVFLLIAFGCLIAAVFVTRGSSRTLSASTASAVVLGLLILGAAPPRAGAQPVGPGAPAASIDAASGSGESAGTSDASELVEGDLQDQGASGATASPGTTVQSPRERFNRANEALAQGDGVAASALLRAARRDAPDDPELRYAATYNLGMAAVLRADGLLEENPKEALSDLQEATDWFREAASMRPEESAPRHNLEVTLRRALILEDEIAGREGGEVETELDALVEAQRARVGASAQLLEAVTQAGDLEISEGLRPFFRDAATDQRVLLTQAEELAERIVREQEAIAAQPEASRAPEEALRAAQLDGVLVYLDGAINRMGQTRRQLRQRRAERAYRRASAALGELKRARDQLRDPVQQIGVLLQEVAGLAGSTQALAARARSESATQDAGDEAPRLPAFLTPATLEEESRRLESRVRDLGVRLEQASIDAQASAGAPPTPPDPSGGGAPQPSPADREALRESLSLAAPLVSQASLAMEGVTAAMGSETFEVALAREAETGRLLAEAQEVFFDLRQLLDVSHADEERIAAVAAQDDQAETEEASRQRVPRAELRPLLQASQSKNLARAERLARLLERERENRLAALAAEGQSAAAAPSPDPDPDPDPIAVEEERFALARDLLARAEGGMDEANVALGTAVGGAPDWAVVAEASGRARDRLGELQSLFFTLIEHLRKLAVDQTDLGDRTQDAIALAVTEDSPGRGPETRARAALLAGEQRPLGERAGVLADALLEQAEAMAAAPEDAGAPATAPGEEPPADRMRRAAEHVALAQQAMGVAADALADDEAELPPAQAAQSEAVQEIQAALELLSPPPPPQEQPQNDDSQQDQEQDSDSGSDPESSPPPESGEDESDPASENQPAQEQETTEDPSELLQGVRDREAERRRDQERDQQRRRSQPVDRDW